MTPAYDGATKRITLPAGTTVLSVTELWSRTMDWMATGDNSKWGAPLRQVGGDIAAIPIYVFLNDTEGWGIVPQSANHTLTVTDGVLYTESGADPFVDPAGAYKIRINRETPGIAIGYSSTGSAGPSAADIAAALLAAAQAAPIHADARRINGAGLAGTGVPGDEWGPA